MGTHVWTDRCDHCGFEDMQVSTYDSFYHDVVCQICGYRRWTEERTPSHADIDLAKQALRGMSNSAKERAVMQHEEDGIPLVVRLRNASS